MPWFLQQRGNEWCVRKGTKEAPKEIVKCHPTHADALAHLRAICVNYYGTSKGLGEGQGVGVARQEVGGVEQCVCPKCDEIVAHDRGTPCVDQICPECGAHMMPKVAENKDGPSVQSVLEGNIHSSFTVLADILYAMGYIAKEERLELSSAIGDSLDELAKTADKLGLEERKIDPYVASILLGLRNESIEDTSTQSQQQPASLFVPYKDAITSEDRWIGVSTAEVWDLEDTLFTTQAMDYDIQYANRTKDFPELRLYHVRGFKLGICDYMSRIGKWAVDKGKWYKTNFAQAMKDIVCANNGRWKMSRGFHVVKATGLCSTCDTDLMVSPWNFLFGIQCKSCGAVYGDVSDLKRMQYLATITYDLTVSDVPIVPVTAIAAYTINDMSPQYNE